MSKRRKYDIKNKRSLIIIVILSVLVVAIFSLFIYKYSKTSKIEYKIHSGSVLQDVDKNYLTIDDDATLKIRWNDNYYLIYNNEKITLGKKVIVYNSITGGMNLYGDFYEISSDGKVIENKYETILPNTGDTKFYKIADREYLLVANKIYSVDYSIEANNYLLVELDKGGNAKLSNNKINLKTISPTTLVTDKYSFDINNEILNFGQYDIDLKKIIGSTNQYVEESADGDDDNDQGADNNIGAGGLGTGNGAGNGTGSGTGAGSGTGNGAGNGTETDDNVKDEDVDIEDLLDKVKMTSVIRVVEGLDKIDVDYVIYDPYNEYGSVYIEVYGNGEMRTVYLSKTDTHVTIPQLTTDTDDRLSADTDYKLDFIYTTLKVNEETQEEEYVPNTFAQFDLRTKVPEYSVSIHKVSTVKNKLTYRVKMQEDYPISKINVKLNFYDTTPNTTEEPVEIPDELWVSELSGNIVEGEFTIPSEYTLKESTQIIITIESIEGEDGEIVINQSDSFRFGR